MHAGIETLWHHLTLGFIQCKHVSTAPRQEPRLWWGPFALIISGPNYPSWSQIWTWTLMLTNQFLDHFKSFPLQSQNNCDPHWNHFLNNFCSSNQIPKDKEQCKSCREKMGMWRWVQSQNHTWIDNWKVPHVVAYFLHYTGFLLMEDILLKLWPGLCHNVQIATAAVLSVKGVTFFVGLMWFCHWLFRVNTTFTEFKTY